MRFRTTSYPRWTAYSRGDRRPLVSAARHEALFGVGDRASLWFQASQHDQVSERQFYPCVLPQIAAPFLSLKPTSHSESR